MTTTISVAKEDANSALAALGFDPSMFKDCRIKMVQSVLGDADISIHAVVSLETAKKITKAVAEGAWNE